ncbi:MAG: hypothetical protein BWY76_02283 [bacterium ADurb.Bin429]|nr:MAG: hypothetical protein BWY76_02283 [bacterium ADurb.Bin429]
MDWQATGIGVGGGAGYVTISHNHIHHMPYSCVQTGASKIREYKFVRANPDSPRARGYRLDEIGDTPLTVEAVKRFTAGHVVMEYNYCHDFMLRLDDGGALYAHATHHTVMRGNLLARAGRPNAFGLYYDDEELDSVMEGNIVARCPSPGKGGGSALHLHDNARITVRHNIFAFSHRLCSVPNSYGGIRLTENIFLFSGGCLPGPEPKTVRGPGDGRRQPDWDAGPSTMDRNLYWSADQPDAARAFLAAWQAKGWDAHSAVADPRFADAANLDFTLPADSPALKLGFQALELTDVGPRKEWRE